MKTKTYYSYPGEPISLAGNKNIKPIGRHTLRGGAVAVDWTNSGFAFNFHGTGLIIALGPYSAEQPAYVKIVIDGGLRCQRFAIVDGSEKLIIEGLNDGRHRVEVLKITEGASKVVFESVSLLGQNAKLNLPPHNRPRRLEFIGDSITAGYGVLGTERDPGYLTYQQDGTYAYAYLTADALNAEGRYICLSGKGIVCNCNGDRTDVKAGQFYEYVSVAEGGVCEDGWVPDAVIINIGTNDAGGPASFEEFAAAGEDLIAKVRARYPECRIIWLYGMMNDYYLGTISELIRRLSANDRRLYMLHVDSISASRGEIGANGHPNLRANLRASALLVKKLTSLFGWRVRRSERGAGSEKSED